MKIVINACYGGFGLSEKAILRYAELKGLTLYPEGTGIFTTYWRVPEDAREDQSNYFTWSLKEQHASNMRRAKQVWHECEIQRDDPALVQVVEELGADANARFAELEIVEIPDGVAWQIEEYDGLERVAEKHRTWEPGVDSQRGSTEHKEHRHDLD